MSSANNGIKPLKVSIISPILHSNCLTWFIINSRRSPPQGLVRSNAHSSLLKCCTAASVLILMVLRSSLSAFVLSNEAKASLESTSTLFLRTLQIPPMNRLHSTRVFYSFFNFRRKTSSFFDCPSPPVKYRGGGTQVTQQMFIRGGSAPTVQTLNLLHVVFHGKRYPFRQEPSSGVNKCFNAFSIQLCTDGQISRLSP